MSRVFLHGMWGGSRHWAGLEGLALELPGFGATPNPAQDFRPAFLAEWVLERMPERAVLVGNSLGGRVAVAVAERAPENVEGLVLVSPAGLTPPATWLKALPKFRIPNASVDPHVYVELALAQVFGRGLDDPRTVPLMQAERNALAGVSFASFLQGSARCLTEMTRDVPDEARLRALAPKVKGLIWGRHDRLIPLSVAETLHGIWPSARLEVIEDSGHVPQLETPGAFCAALERCLKA